MPRWIGFLGSWALLVLALGLASFAVAGEWINARDLRQLDRFAAIDPLLAERFGNAADNLRATKQQRGTEVSALQSKVDDLAKDADLPDSGQTIIISTEENRLYVRRNGQTVTTAICSTGKGTKLAVDGRTVVFDTPIGKFHILSKDQDPQWVPPDWHYIEQAHKNGMRVIHLNPGQVIDADTGQPVSSPDEGVWSWLGGGSRSRRVLRIKGNTIVENSGGNERELPPGKLIIAGGAVVVPPVSSPQRHFANVLGKYRLNLGDGYAIHGTDDVSKLGRSVSHGCVRLGDSDIAKLFATSNVGDEVIIY